MWYLKLVLSKTPFGLTIFIFKTQTNIVTSVFLEISPKKALCHYWNYTLMPITSVDTIHSSYFTTIMRQLIIISTVDILSWKRTWSRDKQCVKYDLQNTSSLSASADCICTVPEYKSDAVEAFFSRPSLFEKRASRSVSCPENYIHHCQLPPTSTNQNTSARPIWKSPLPTFDHRHTNVHGVPALTGRYYSGARWRTVSNVQRGSDAHACVGCRAMLPPPPRSGSS